MQRCQERNVKLNKEKVKLRRKEVTFMGHLISEKGLKPDPAKGKAVLDMPTLTDVTSVRRFIGLANHLNKFFPLLSEVCKPLRDLTLQDAAWLWSDIHVRAIDQLKLLVTSVPVLTYFDATKDATTLQ